MNFEIIEIIPHDIFAYTQGYFFKDGYLYESTGLYGHSSLRKVNPRSGESLKTIQIDRRYFSEGIEYYKNKIYMLTWKEKVCKVFNYEDFKELNEFIYQGEGWGISLFENKFYMSNGTNTIQIIDPETFSVIDKFEVLNNKNALKNLNELQVIEQNLLANIWFSDQVALINLKDKNLNGFLDFGVLRKYLKNSRAEVLNGIAFDNQEKTLYVTGKFWDLCFKIKLDSTFFA